MKLDLSEHDDDAHGAIKTAEGRAVVPLVLLLDSLRAGRPWRMVLQDVAQRFGRAWPQSWYWLRPGGWPEDMAAWLREQCELIAYQDRQRKSGMGELAFMFTDLNEQIKSGQPRRRAKRLEFPLPGDADDLPGLLDCRLFDHAALERVTSRAALMAGDHGRVAIDLEDVRRVFPELEIVGDHGAEAIFRRMESAGVWPRPEVPKGQAAGEWLDTEREAAFELRHRFKVSDAELAQRIGVSRTAINGQIWPKQGRRWELAEPSSARWKPPVVLLRRCGLPVPGLHEVERVPEVKRALSPAK